MGKKEGIPTRPVSSVNCEKKHYAHEKREQYVKKLIDSFVVKSCLRSGHFLLGRSVVASAVENNGFYAYGDICVNWPALGPGSVCKEVFPLPVSEHASKHTTSCLLLVSISSQFDTEGLRSERVRG